MSFWQWDGRAILGETLHLVRIRGLRGLTECRRYMSGLQPSGGRGYAYLGLRPRLVYAGPLAL